MKTVRNSSLYAFAVGFWERLRWGDGFGRTHPTDLDWNDAYDRGANLSDLIIRR